MYWTILALLMIVFFIMGMLTNKNVDSVSMKFRNFWEKVILSRKTHHLGWHSWEYYYWALIHFSWSPPPYKGCRRPFATISGVYISSQIEESYCLTPIPNSWIETFIGRNTLGRLHCRRFEEKNNSCVKRNSRKE